jgi:hypothetical protein
MTVRLNILFNGSPDEGVQSLREIVGRNYETVAFSRFAKWRHASKQSNVWSLDVDVVPLDRAKVIYLLPIKNAQDEDVESSKRELTSVGNLILGLSDEWALDLAQRIKLQQDCVDVCDRVFVVNTLDVDIDEETQSIIDFALDTGKRVAYLNY